MSTNEYISVSELNLYIKSYMENNYFLQDVYVKGEISNFKVHQTGTLYFAIKDDKSAVNVVMFANYANKIKVPLKDGDMVLIRGKISVYEVRGTYSINATEVIFDSKGMLLIAYEELKKKLASEGLFDLENKKPLPKYPTTIGLITASSGAAVQDMLRTIKTRWPIAQVYIFPTLVQGENAKYDIVRKIKEADERKLDVLICGRGGGSIEDLWAFNEEMVARAFYECNTPIISAVGHEIDTVISDYVADVRGLTPTDGAVKATPNIKDELVNIKKNYDYLVELMNNYLVNLTKKVNNLKDSYVLVNPTKIYETYQYKIDDLISSLNDKIKELTSINTIKIINYKNDLNRLITNNIVNSKQRLVKCTSSLDSLSPLKVLNRGYGFVTVKEKIVRSINDVNKDDLVKLSLNDGKLVAKVVDKEK